MKLIQNTLWIGIRYYKWSLWVAITYFFKGVARKTKIAPTFFLHVYQKALARSCKKKWLKEANGIRYFDFNGTKFPDISANVTDFNLFNEFIFNDVFLIPCYYNDNHDKSVVKVLDRYMLEGPYGYKDGDFDVRVKQGDVVIDVGAWAGDFSAYAVSKGARCYAFEPVNKTFAMLCETSELNAGNIHPIQKGLGSKECEVNITISETNSGENSMVIKNDHFLKEEKIAVTTLDQFVAENNLSKIDFIKVDIEGAERDMLKGATQVLKTFAPKLAICTYHLPDDPQVLEEIILEANPDYKVIHLRHKLFAAVIK
jgi:FkbM family methyltransferase